MEDQGQPIQLPVEIGEILLGKYRLERVIGQGGMGLVAAARHLDLDELFAIKFLLADRLDGARAVERFLREARAAARLKGEHIVKVVDVGRLGEGGTPYMVMEYLRGTDLKHLLRERGPLPIDEILDWMLQACEAMAEAHQHNIVHRDLKPANLFLTRRPNGTPCIKVLDFGVSKHLSPHAQNITKSGEIIGSPLYMSPEQIVRVKETDVRSDIWALGVILYELAAGISPFRAPSFTEVVGSVLQDEPAPLHQARPDIPPWYEAIVARCLQKRPDQRFQTIGELSAALKAMGGHPDTAERPSAQSLEIKSIDSVPPPSAASASRPSQSLSTDSAWGGTRPDRRISANSKLILSAVLAGIVAAAIYTFFTLRIRKPAEPSPAGAPAVSLNAAPAISTSASPKNSSSP